MKKKLLFLLATVFLVSMFYSPIVNAEDSSTNENRSLFNDIVVVPDLDFSADLTDSGVKIKWSTYAPAGFNFYKVIRSTRNDNPIYPEDGYIFYSENNNTNYYFDNNILADKTYFYRVCSIAMPNRYCSEVIKIETPEDFAQASKIDKEETKDVIKDMKEKMKKIMNFKDIKESDWVYPFARKLGDLGIVNTNNEKLSPYNQISRAEAVTLMVRAYEKINGIITVDTDYDFFDVNENFWAYTNLKKALTVGVIAENTMFRPGQNITRAQFAKIVATTFFNDSIAEVRDDVYKDVPVTYWASEYIQILKLKGVINDDTDANFNPDKPLSRAEGLKIISKAIEIVNPDLSEASEEDEI